MYTLKIILNFIAAIALAVAGTAAIVAVGYLDDDPGMGGIAMVLVLLFWAAPALIIAVFSFSVARIIGAREKLADVPSDLAANSPISSHWPVSGTHKVGRFLVRAGALYLLWCVAQTVYVQFQIVPLLAQSGNVMMWLIPAIIGTFAAAVPGLLICWLGYWLRGRPGPEQSPYQTA